jgi:hypothetical protein
MWSIVSSAMTEETVVIKIRFPKYLHEWLKAKASQEVRSLSNQITYYIKEAYDAEKKGQGGGEKGKSPREGSVEVRDEGQKDGASIPGRCQEEPESST